MRAMQRLRCCHAIRTRPRANIVAAVNSQRVHATILGVRTPVVAGLIGFSSWLAIDLTRPRGGVSAIWLAIGLLIDILLTSPHRDWPAYVVAGQVGSLIARAAYGDLLLAVAGRALGSTLEVCVVVYSLRYLVGM